MNIPEEFKHRHPATLEVFKFFAYDHLPEPMKSISKANYNLAYHMIYDLPDCPELTAGLRKLLEGKDCFVRTSLALPQKESNYPQWPQDAPPLPVKDNHT
jgi:hypothetical protein